MKTRIYLSIIIIALFGCQKEYSPTNKVSSSTTSNTSTDGILTVNVSILPPVTPQTFLANKPGGATSYGAYDYTASQYVSIEYAYFNASPTVKMINQYPRTHFILDIFPSTITVKYNNVNSKTSPKVAKVTLTGIYYRTYDYAAHFLTVDSVSGGCQPVCIVNNIAHLSFYPPKKYYVYPNGYVEIAKLLLTGDTSWTLNSLPTKCYDPTNGAPFGGASIAKCKGLIVGKYRDGAIRFDNGFKHLAGQTDTIRLYSKIQLGGGYYLATTIGDLNYFEWVDGVGGLITGDLNSRFYKEQVGIAYIHNGL
jgi:hypothetical protein